MTDKEEMDENITLDEWDSFICIIRKEILENCDYEDNPNRRGNCVINAIRKSIKDLMERFSKDTLEFMYSYLEKEDILCDEEKVLIISNVLNHIKKKNRK
jgi:hypothetical protein